jgi:hypothetical protein
MACGTPNVMVPPPMSPRASASASEEPLVIERAQPGPRCDTSVSEGRNVPPVTEPVKSLGVSLAEDEKGRGAAELQVGDTRYLLDRDQVDYLIHTLIRMRRSIQHPDAAPQS